MLYARYNIPYHILHTRILKVKTYLYVSEKTMSTRKNNDYFVFLRNNIFWDERQEHSRQWPQKYVKGWGGQTSREPINK